jgi:RNA polymerase sigma-70 factor (ECF subfamily)
MSQVKSRQDELYEEATDAYATALGRLARSYELDPEKRRDLLQEIHLAVWRSFAAFAAQCSLRTWVYRVAHNVATSHVIRHRRARAQTLVSLDEIAALPDRSDTEASVARQMTLDQLHALIHRLNPLERQVILLYLEGLDATAIGEITGISPGNVATRIHRIKRILADRFLQGALHAR